MARSINTIFQSIVTAKTAEPLLAELDSVSMVAIWRLMCYCVAVCQWTLEKLFDIHVDETKELLAKEKPGRPKWYAEIAKKFQFGYTLVDDQDYYDNTGIDEATILASQVVKYSACVDLGTELRIKVAGSSGGSLAPITTPQLTAFKAYMARVKYGGVYLTYTNSGADSLKLSYKIYYNPLVLDATGKRLDGTNDTPIQDAIDDYLTNGIEFNGFFVTSTLTDLLQEVDGVVVPAVELAQSRYGILPFTDIDNMVQPDAGYLRIFPADLTLTFIPSPY